ncbi:M16 family metallopeptidase [Geomonas subterranea]|uniref:Insulinase family protein n=1 Tax=Geomonas subterranea TaxID=2847989 RepID=A0ABX8LGJ0_9BACT|nr:MULTISPECIES: pitrilysin family protein [Geomonas]QXE91143.1 insulinase family protein [Geomonas subterranea]QXM10770.1 insulinase family protein [Geomonas subterranea]
MIKKTTLNNGIRVITERIPYASSVSIGIWVANGSRHERRESNGVAHFIEHLLFKGTERRSSLDIAREIDSVGGVLNAFTSREYVCYYAKVLDKFLPRAVDLLTDIFLHSTFDSEEIEKERRVVLQEINMMEDTPDDLIHDLFHQHFWKGHPLGMSILGDAESVTGLSRDAIIAYKDQMYRADDVIVTAAGNVTHEKLTALLEEFLHGVEPGHGRSESVPPVYERRIELVEKDLEQIHVCLGLKGVQQSHPQRYDAFIMNAILGGSMSSRLFQEVREKSGLAYSVYSYIASHADAGSLVVYAGASPENSKELLEIMLREIGRFKHEPVSADQLEAAREQLKGNLLLSLESSDNRMSRLAKNEIYFGTPLPLTEIMDGFDRVTSDSIMELANEILDNDALTLVMLGRIGTPAFSASDINV